MKKVILLFALALFVTFGALSIQTAVASTDNMEIVQKNLDDDPDKNKKAEANADGKDKKKNAKSCDKKKSCCKEAASKKCETDKKASPADDKKEVKEGGDKK